MSWIKMDRRAMGDFSEKGEVVLNNGVVISNNDGL